MVATGISIVHYVQFKFSVHFFSEITMNIRNFCFIMFIEKSKKSYNSADLAQLYFFFVEAEYWYILCEPKRRYRIEIERVYYINVFGQTLFGFVFVVLLSLGLKLTCYYDWPWRTTFKKFFWSIR